jgi:hypothetical protein
MSRIESCISSAPAVDVDLALPMTPPNGVMSVMPTCSSRGSMTQFDPRSWRES